MIEYDVLTYLSGGEYEKCPGQEHGCGDEGGKRMQSLGAAHVHREFLSSRVEADVETHRGEQENHTTLRNERR